MTPPERGPAGTWQHLCAWRNGRIDPGETLAFMPPDDLHAALDIAAERENLIHHDTAAGCWYIWDGRCHRPDSSGQAERMIYSYALRYQQALDAVRAEVRSAAALAGITAPAELRQAVEASMRPFDSRVKYAAGLRRSAGAGSLLRYLAGMTGILGSELDDRHPGWLNFASGTVDLATGLQRPHDPADMITYCLDLDYRPGAQCPRFWSLLSHVAGHDPQTAWYLLAVLGYCLLGWNPEQLVFFIKGPTSDGKTTLLGIVSSVLGALAHDSQPALVTLVRHGRNARTENSIRGARLITITETSAFMTIDEAQIKRLTGERRISVDQHYAKTEIKTPVTWTIILATNQMPSLVNFDEAIRRRVIVIPGGPTIPAHLRDPHLAARITAEESEGIAAMLVRACVHYHREGLKAPAVVEEATGEYAAEQNTVAAFTADTCLKLDISVHGIHAGAVAQNAAWQAYQMWSRGQGHLGRNEFYAHMAAQPGVFRNDEQRRFEGITWSDTWRARLNGQAE